MIQQNKKAWSWLWLSIVIILLDQGSKYLAVRYLTYAEPYEIFPFFNLWLKYNAGAAYGFLGSAGGWQIFLLSGISIIVSLVLVFWLGRTLRRDWMMALGLSLVLGGAIGNLIDRLRFNFVVDFFDFHVGDWHFATFNVADSAISVGAAFLILRVLFFEEKK